MAVLLAFAASVGWGVADFLGGVEGRRLSFVPVVAAVQLTGFATVAIVLVLAGKSVPALGVLGIAGLSGLAQTVGVGSYYRGLSTGAMGVVGPIAATGALVPLAVGLLSGERPGPLQVVGMLLAIAGAVTTAYQPSPPGVEAKRAAVGAGMAVLAALGFGTFFTLVGLASEDADLLWIVFANRGVSAAAVGALLLAYVISRTKESPAGPRPGSAATQAARQAGPTAADAGPAGSSGGPAVTQAVRRAGPTAADAAALAASGVLAVAATFVFAAATTMGLLSIVSVLGAIYPVTTVALAAVLLHERLHPVQRIGAAIALLGVAALAGAA